MALKGSGAISEQVIEDSINKAAVAKAQIEAKALQLKYADIIAPDDGVISSRTATLGAVGSSGDELFRLIRQNRLEWRGELTPEQAVHVFPGQIVTLLLPNGKQADGLVRQVAPSYNSETRMKMIFVTINNGSSAQAGMYAEGQVTLQEKTALSVPAKSVVIRDGRNYVFILSDKLSGATTVSQREVQIGKTRGRETQIISGVSKGNNIVLQGAGFLNDGDIVRISGAKRDLP